MPDDPRNRLGKVCLNGRQVRMGKNREKGHFVGGGRRGKNVLRIVEEKLPAWPLSEGCC